MTPEDIVQLVQAATDKWQRIFFTQPHTYRAFGGAVLNVGPGSAGSVRLIRPGAPLRIMQQTGDRRVMR